VGATSLAAGHLLDFAQEVSSADRRGRVCGHCKHRINDIQTLPEYRVAPQYMIFAEAIGGRLPKFASFGRCGAATGYGWCPLSATNC
jgi:hypothetical protein